MDEPFAIVSPTNLQEDSGDPGSGAPPSVLFAPSEERPSLEQDVPSFFTDLNLDRVVDALCEGRDEYDLKPYFYTRLTALDAIAYRHEVLRDLEERGISSYVDSFAEEMRRVRRHLGVANKLRYKEERQAWFLDAAEIYCGAVEKFASGLTDLELESRGLRTFRGYLARYSASDRFRALVDQTRGTKERLAGVRYLLNVRGSRIKVSRYDDPEPGYTAEIEGTFERFQQGAVKDYRASFPDSSGLNHVEAAVLALVAELHPEVFAALDSYCERQRDFVDEAVATFDREVQFYLAYLEYVDRIRGDGLEFCYPTLSDRSKEPHVKDGFDLALADKLVPEGSPVIVNDLALRDPERIIVVSGPNQGGKTTFARMFGQLHYLAGIGCLVPAREAQLFLFDQLFTHFEKEEDITDLTGKLEDDLLRIHEILERATADSIVIMNESLTSTALMDARLIGRAVLERMIKRDLLAVYVTFVDELASVSEATVSMVGTVVPGDPASRTYRVVRRPADGLAYAAAIAEKYGLTYKCLKERVTG